ncbi:response regulator [Anthocerotibacter panamensis]|uniref:response regulator n=1 Tax=Anthocerotibacter panamensis TaxID=2857077 RepID=UPI001C402DBC|nr:response regulator [Anthocerotibacter panamensis]
MTFHPPTGKVPPASNDLLRQFESFKQDSFSGRFDIQAMVPGKPLPLWSFYFYLGRLFFATGGLHGIRRWQRLIAQYQLPADIKQHQALTCRSWQYTLLYPLVRQGRVTREQAIAVANGLVDELLFEVHPAAELIFRQDPEDPCCRDVPPVLISVPETLERLRRNQLVWQAASLGKFSPDQAPLLRQPLLLQEKLSAKAYQSLYPLLDGQHTLREVASQVNLAVPILGRTLSAYLQEGALGMVQVPDLAPPAPLPTPSSAPLIACIDDSLQICQTMEQILTGAGYRYFSVQDPLRGLVMLVQRKPDLIFLDLVMPNTNGYEVCSKLRKVAQFRQTPIIILTGNDGLIDRVRSKLVGASGFIGKPAGAYLVLKVVSRHLKKASQKLLK